MAMTAGQFFLCLLIIIILRESLASARGGIEDSPALIILELQDSAVGDSTRSGARGSSSVFPAVNMADSYKLPRLHAQQTPAPAGGELKSYSKAKCNTIQGVPHDDVGEILR